MLSDLWGDRNQISVPQIYHPHDRNDSTQVECNEAVDSWGALRTVGVLLAEKLTLDRLGGTGLAVYPQQVLCVALAAPL